MEVGEIKDEKEPQVAGLWVPATPMKPNLQKTVPIYSSEQENQLQLPHYYNGAVACSKFVSSVEQNNMQCAVPVTQATMENVVGENGKACAETISLTTPSFSKLLELMQENAASKNLNATQSSIGLTDPFFLTSDLPLTSNTEMNNTRNTQDSLQQGNNNASEIDKTPQQKQRRRKHRPKVIVEGKPKRTRKPTNKDNLQPKENSTGKRKYVRKNGVNKTVSTPEETELMPEFAKKSCRRTLFDETVREQGFAGREDAAAHSHKDDEIGETQVLSTKPNRRKEKQKENQPVKRKYTRKRTSNNESTPGSGETTNLTKETELQHASARGTNSSNDSMLLPEEVQGSFPCNSSDNNMLSSEEQHQMQSMLLAEELQHQMQCSLLDSQPTEKSDKKRRGGRRKKMNESCAAETTKESSEPVILDQRPSTQQGLKDFYISLPIDTSGRNTNGAQFNGMASYQTNCCLSDIEKKRKRETGSTSTSSPKEVPQEHARWLSYPSSSHMILDENYEDFVSMLRRGTKDPTPQAGIYRTPSRMHNRARRNHQPALDKSLGILDAVDLIVKQFRELNINTQENALIPYKQKKRKQKRLTLGDGTIIPLENQLVPVKKQFPRPRVDLDEETERVWKLLMLDINSHGIDGNDEQKAKWWREERNVFRGRADSFIARMHLVQGDRRFSRWKGSVVDSVVGVFLTQNVSDHLSSSAFMALAARFPPKSTSSEASTSMLVKEESTEEGGAKELNQSIDDRSSIRMEVKENSREKCVSSLTDESQRQELSPGKNEEKEELNDIASSQSPVISYPTFGDSSNDQNHEKIGSSSNNNSEVEDLLSTTMYSNTSLIKHFEKLTDASRDSMDLKNDIPSVNECSLFNISGQTQDPPQKERQLDLGAQKNAAGNGTNEVSSMRKKADIKGKGKEKKDEFNWDSLRIEAQAKAGKRKKTENTMDSLDWEAVRTADVSVISDVIKERGMNNRLAERIQDFLNRLVEEHGGIDLEWLRDVPPDKAKEFLLSVRGLGLKSVECVRLLTLHHLAFPVDTNVGRIAVRLGWVPLQPLPESLQLHLVELYPILESIQKYLWPRLCKLDQKTLYELHYQMITFGKVFCTKISPNCNACPMRGECRHFASAFASARLALPGPEQKNIVSTIASTSNNTTVENPTVSISQLRLPLLENANQGAEILQAEVSRQLESISAINVCHPIIEEPNVYHPIIEEPNVYRPIIEEPNVCHPIIEEPKTPEPECSQVAIHDIEDAFWVDSDSCEIPTINLNIEEFTQNLQNYMQGNMELQEAEMSKALVALTPEAANIPMPKLKNVGRLRTEHCVYELPDTHPLLNGWDKREIDDPGKYLLAIWTPGETANSIQPPESKCSSQETGQLCNEKECLSCNSVRESNSQTVRGTLLIPCRTAMRGSFPLNGTYFQVNEVFADHESSMNPISVPRRWIWNLNRRTVYFGTAVSSIFKGLSTAEIQQCFWRGYVCVRGFDRTSRAPRPLIARLHFPASKMPKTPETTRKRSTTPKSKGAKTKPGQPEQPELVSDSNNIQKGEENPKENVP
ncbi:hypothetical protein PIB30_042507 [Stylosanthes scabra]|uniref:HhH-GPD domain-containing protein n=1 Tax=Stylosanthes scabra TaxID=79078 RepID=A0ABU6RFC4_9FABA|nr:hypothetical protein [Stylosanthes scabra]